MGKLVHSTHANNSVAPNKTQHANNLIGTGNVGMCESLGPKRNSWGTIAYDVTAGYSDALIHHFNSNKPNPHKFPSQIQSLSPQKYSLSSAMASSSPSLVMILLIALLMAMAASSQAAISKGSFEENFSIMWSKEHFTTSKDGQIWYLSLDKETGK